MLGAIDNNRYSSSQLVSQIDVSLAISLVLGERDDMAIAGAGGPRERLRNAVLGRVPKPSLPAEATATEASSVRDAVADAAPANPASPRARSPLEMSPINDPKAAEQLLKSEAFAAGEPRPPEETASASVAAIGESLDKLWGFAIPTRLLAPSLQRYWWIGPIISGGIPAMINGLLIVMPGHMAVHTLKAWEWIAIFACTQAAALVAGQLLWRRLIRDMDLIADMLPDKQADIKLASWVRAWYSVPLQAAFGCGMGGAGVLVLWLSSKAVERAGLELGVVSYLSVAWTSFIGGLLVYVFLMVTFLTSELRACGPLVLDPWDPASTPGLRSLSLGYIYCLSFLIVLAGGLEIVARSVPGYPLSGVLRLFVILFAIFAVACGLLVLILPHVRIFQLTYVNKLQTRAVIDEEIGDMRASMTNDHGRLVVLVWLRSQVFNAPAIPIRLPWMLPLTAALLGPLVAFLTSVKK